MKVFWKVFTTLGVTYASPLPNHNSASNIHQQAFGVPVANPGNSVNAFHQNRYQVNQLQQLPRPRNPYMPLGRKPFSFFPNTRIIPQRPWPRPNINDLNYKNMTFDERFEHCKIVSGEFDSNIPSAKDGFDQDQVRVILILDETGSMSRNKENTIVAYNEFLAKQKESSDSSNDEDGSGKNGISGENETDDLEKEKKSPRYSLVKFDIDLKTDNSDSILKSPELTHKTYQPGGSTALFDAIGCTIQAYKKEMFNILVVLTDGEENSSKLFDQKDTKKMIDDMVENQKWQVQYLGANQDAFSVAGSIGIGNAVGYVADAAGFKSSFGKAASFSLQQRNRQYSKMLSYRQKDNS